MSMNINTGPANSSSSGSTIDYLSYLGNLSPDSFNPNTVINALLNVQQIPITNLQTQIKNIQTNQSIYQSIGNDVSALQSSAFNLTLQSITQANTATSSNSGAVTATASPLAQAGTYTVAVSHIATATKATSTAGLGTAIDAVAGNTALSALSLGATPTAGTASVVVDGQVKSFNVDTSKALTDPSGGALTQLQSAIASGLGVDANTVSVGVANDEVQVSISGATTAHTISFGAAGDTSNFLQVMNLSTVQGSTANGALNLSSSALVGVAQPGAALQSAKLATPINGASGSFTVNGVSIAWNGATDSINSVLQKINNSSAGVIAQYNSSTDNVQLTSKTTGQAALNLQDTTGNFLAAMKLAPGTTNAQTLGANAGLTVNGVPITSASNTVTNAVPGLTINALGDTPNGSPATITVGPDTAGITKQVQSFVDAANKVLGDINTTQQKDLASGKYSQLFGDPTLTGLRSQILTMITGHVTSSGAYQSLQDIGITTGAVGSTSGTAPLALQLDTTKLAAAIAANPGQVAALFNGTSANNGFQGVAQTLSPYLKGLANPVSGAFALEQSTGNTEIKQYQDHITQMQAQIAARRQILVTQFSAMSKAMSALSAQLAALGSVGGTSSSSTSSSSSSGH